MNRAALSIILLAVLAHSSIAQTVKNTLGRRGFDRLYRAVVDIATTCYGDPGKAIGVIGDVDGSILKVLRSNHSSIPVVLVDGLGDSYDHCNNAVAYKLQVFIIAVNSPTRLLELIIELNNYIWWNQNANFLIVDTRPELRKQCLSNAIFMYVTTKFAMLNAQFICYDLEEHEDAITIYTSNPFTPRAPKVWTFIREYTVKTRKTRGGGFLFARTYKDGGRSCRSINFAKTTNAGGSPLHFVTNIRPSALRRGADVVSHNKERLDSSRIIVASWFEEHRWFIDNIVNAINVSEVITAIPPNYVPGIGLESTFLSSYTNIMGKLFDQNLVRRNQWPVYAVTQHTGHMTQLDKVLSVIDRKSRIGVGLVYFITFLFFKFFMRQAVMPALLNIVRLTSNSGLTTLPQNVAPTLYLTSLFIFVVTLQAIYTGNLATLLTTTISYPNVQVKGDIAKLGYTLYLAKDTLNKLIADPSLDGCIVEIPREEHCIDYVLRDPLAACALDHIEALGYAVKFNLHVSRVPLMHDYAFHTTSASNILRSRIEEVLIRYFEAGMSYTDLRLESLRLQLIDDDEVKKNTARRVMTFDDLRFAFVILGIGLSCSLVCFVGEVVICRVRLRIAKRRDRVRVRSAWGVTAKRCSWFPSLNCRFDLRRLFSNRR